MGSNGARIFLPPYAEPIRPFADPILWRELSWYGAHMAYKEEEANLSGAINGAIYSGWGHFGFHWITPFHNIAGMLTESAAARLASPRSCIPISCVAVPEIYPCTKPRPSFPTPGRADGGTCATSWSGKRFQRGQRSTWRRVIAKRYCGTLT